MKKIKIKGIEEEVYYEKLDNGLEVYLYTKENVHMNYVTFTTRYGSVYKADSEYLWLNTSANPSDTSSVEATKYSSARIYVYDKEDKEY